LYQNSIILTGDVSVRIIPVKIFNIISWTFWNLMS
jgi:hypothetical protein